MLTYSTRAPEVGQNVVITSDVAIVSARALIGNVHHGAPNLLVYSCPIGNVVDKLTVVDSAGGDSAVWFDFRAPDDKPENIAQAIVEQQVAALVLYPRIARVVGAAHVQFHVNGAAQPIEWNVDAPSKLGIFNPETHLYITTGKVPGIALVKLKDALGRTATAVIEVAMETKED